jgi:hypothetical protein
MKLSYLFSSIALILLTAVVGNDQATAQPIALAEGLSYPKYECQEAELIVSRSDYYEKLRGFWLGQCIANWTGLRTEGVKKTAPFFTDKAWGTNQGRNKQIIEFVLVEEGQPWGSDSDTDVACCALRLAGPACCALRLAGPACCALRLAGPRWCPAFRRSGVGLALRMRRISQDFPSQMIERRCDPLLIDLPRRPKQHRWFGF